MNKARVKLWGLLFALAGGALLLNALCIQPGALIASAKWNNFGNYSPTLTITPTALGRFLAAEEGLASLAGFHAVDDYIAGTFWTDIGRATPVKQVSLEGSKSLYQQFVCHLYLAGKNPLQRTWNIDANRVAANEFDQVTNLCNYPKYMVAR